VEGHPFTALRVEAHSRHFTLIAFNGVKYLLLNYQSPSFSKPITDHLWSVEEIASLLDSKQ
jgi:hypothetical protein